MHSLVALKSDQLHTSTLTKKIKKANKVATWYQLMRHYCVHGN
jgi:hypothetical protein